MQNKLNKIQTGHDKFVFLRQNYPEFIYEKFEYKINDSEKYLYIKFYFVQMQIDLKTNKMSKFTNFNPTLKLSLDSEKEPIIKYFPNLKNKANLDKIIFNIGMIELISYWKACVSPKIIIKPKFTLTNRQIKFWKEIYLNGLGEYIFLNQITISQKDIFEIIPYRKQSIKNNEITEKNEIPYFSNIKNMIPIGGGKDSIVTIELLKEMNKMGKSTDFYENNYAIIMNPREATLKTAEIEGFKKDKIIIVKRTIDKNLLELNKLGYLNGHTPFSALLAFITSLVSFTYGIKNIALSNEDSASESNVTFNELEINHQYSKSFEAEKELNWYMKKYLHSSINYFSLLRPLYEIQIALLFARYAGKYFSDFRSCNAGSKRNIWCNNCPKCLFVYIILSPFIPQNKLVKEIFGENLLDKLELEVIFLELLGEKENKPFECVGTYEEVKISLYLLYKNFEQLKVSSEKKYPVLLSIFIDKFLNKENNIIELNRDSSTIFKHFNEKNLTKPVLIKKLKQIIEKL